MLAYNREFGRVTARAASPMQESARGRDMPDRRTVRSYIEIEDPSDDLIALYRDWTGTGVERLLRSFNVAFADPIPPANWRLQPYEALSPDYEMPRPTHVVFAFAQSENDVTSNLSLPRTLAKGVTLNASPEIAAADVWCPVGGGDTTFGTRANALSLIRAGGLATAGARGQGVHVVIVDQGLDRTRLLTYISGWNQDSVMAGAATGGHGMMVARNVLSVAPNAFLWDCPLIPEAIEDVSSFMDVAADAMNVVLDTIRVLKLFGLDKWVIVNSWAVYDRRTETPTGDYTADRNHAFNVAMGRANAMEIDVVFAAGNCGEFCPKGRCGPDDRGQGESILGANSLANVLTAGAVRADGTWIGYSSQGPGKIDQAKPDLCAPAQFADPGDASPVNSGSSTSAALAAGLIAALRSLRRKTVLTPEQMRQLLRARARPGSPADGANQIGSGVLDAQAALDNMPP
ncbi:MAG: S8 family serine peptidase [Rhodospirillales bacterium]|nr:S8 family serine peptidase [Rhodospirillales bacterium]